MRTIEVFAQLFYGDLNATTHEKPFVDIFPLMEYRLNVNHLIGHQTNEKKNQTSSTSTQFCQSSSFTSLCVVVGSEIFCCCLEWPNREGENVVLRRISIQVKHIVKLFMSAAPELAELVCRSCWSLIFSDVETSVNCKVSHIGVILMSSAILLVTLLRNFHIIVDV